MGLGSMHRTMSCVEMYVHLVALNLQRGSLKVKILISAHVCNPCFVLSGCRRFNFDFGPPVLLNMKMLPFMVQKLPYLHRFVIACPPLFDTKPFLAYSTTYLQRVSIIFRS